MHFLWRLRVKDVWNECTWSGRNGCRLRAAEFTATLGLLNTAKLPQGMRDDVMRPETWQPPIPL
jgi:hypothetical protein